MRNYLAVFLLSLSLASAAQIGEGCNMTADCETGYCKDSVCALPSVETCPSSAIIQLGGDCAYTCECESGYCENGKCVAGSQCKNETETCSSTTECCQPLVCYEGKCSQAPENLPAGGILSMGLKSGCAGITAEGASPESLLLCYGLWIVLAVLSLLAGAVAFIKTGNKLLAAAALFLPFIIGAVTLTLLGDAVAFVAIVYFLTRGQKEAALEENAAVRKRRA